MQGLDTEGLVTGSLFASIRVPHFFILKVSLHNKIVQSKGLTTPLGTNPIASCCFLICSVLYRRVTRILRGLVEQQQKLGVTVVCSVTSSAGRNKIHWSGTNGFFWKSLRYFNQDYNVPPRNSFQVHIFYACLLNIFYSCTYVLLTIFSTIVQIYNHIKAKGTNRKSIF